MYLGHASTRRCRLKPYRASSSDTRVHACPSRFDGAMHARAHHCHIIPGFLQPLRKRHDVTVSPQRHIATQPHCVGDGTPPLTESTQRKQRCPGPSHVACAGQYKRVTCSIVTFGTDIIESDSSGARHAAYRRLRLNNGIKFSKARSATMSQRSCRGTKQDAAQKWHSVHAFKQSSGEDAQASLDRTTSTVTWQHAPAHAGAEPPASEASRVTT